MGFLSSIGSAISGSLGGVLGGIGDYFLGKHDSYGAASKQNQYQLYMSNTAHRREIKDLLAAGLNPVLSALGSGASTMAVPVNGEYNRESDTTREAIGDARRNAKAIGQATAAKLLQDAATGQAVEEQAREVAQTERTKQEANRQQAALTAAQQLTEQQRALQMGASARLLGEQAATEATKRALNVASARHYDQGVRESMARSQTYAPQVRLISAQALESLSRGAKNEAEIKLLWAQRAETLERTKGYSIERAYKEAQTELAHANKRVANGKWNLGFEEYKEIARRNDFARWLKNNRPFEYNQLLRTEMLGSTPLQFMWNFGNSVSQGFRE